MQDKFLQLPDYIADVVGQSVRFIELKKDEHLFCTGDKVNGIYFVLSGEMKALRHLRQGGEAIMVRSNAGEFFAESAVAGSKYTCDGIATSATRLAFLSTGELFRALTDPKFAKSFFLAIASNSRRQCSRNERLKLNRARDRVLHLFACESNPEGIFEWQSPIAELAAELAIEPETMYRTLKQLELEKIITRQECGFLIYS